MNQSHLEKRQPIISSDKGRFVLGQDYPFRNLPIPLSYQCYKVSWTYAHLFKLCCLYFWQLTIEVWPLREVANPELSCMCTATMFVCVRGIFIRWVILLLCTTMQFVGHKLGFIWCACEPWNHSRWGCHQRCLVLVVWPSLVPPQCVPPGGNSLVNEVKFPGLITQKR